MSNLEVVRAWKDPELRATLSGVMPDHPAGQIELTDPGLMDAVEVGPNHHSLAGRCPSHSFVLTHGGCGC